MTHMVTMIFQVDTTDISITSEEAIVACKNYCAQYQPASQATVSLSRGGQQIDAGVTLTTVTSQGLED